MSRHTRKKRRWDKRNDLRTQKENDERIHARLRGSLTPSTESIIRKLREAI